jgi:hypothetical protein
LIVRRYEPDDFKELMRKLSPVYSDWFLDSETNQEDRISIPGE